MLRELRLNNLAIIKNLNLEFNEGLIAMTGETGAGKSIILDGISLLIGERNQTEMIRTGEESLFAEGVFDLSEEQVQRLKRIGFDIEDNELIISRYFDRNSKSKVTVNGIRMTVSKLKELMSHILDLVGQHEHQFLLNKNYHLGLLDKFLNKDGTDTVKKIRENVINLKNLNKKIEEIEKELNTNKKGLSDKEINGRIEKHGFNELKEKKKESILIKFIEQFKDMMVIVLIIASIISGIIDLSHGEGLTNTIIILAIVIINAVIGVIQEVRAEKSLEALKKLTQHEAKVIRDRKSYNNTSKNAYSR